MTINMHTGLRPGERLRKYKRLRDKSKSVTPREGDDRTAGNQPDHGGAVTDRPSIDEIADLWENKFREVRSEDRFRASRMPPLAFRTTGVEGVPSPPVPNRDDEVGRQVLNRLTAVFTQPPRSVYDVEGATPEEVNAVWGARGKGVGLGTCVALLSLAPFWIRRPSTWTAEGKPEAVIAASLVNHLFVRYPVPPCLYEAWTPEDAFEPTDEWATSAMDHPYHWASLLVVLGRGGSLKRSALGSFPRGYVARLAEVPYGTSLPEATFRAEVACAGGGRWEWDWLRRVEFFVLDRPFPSTRRTKRDVEKQRRLLVDTVAWLSTQEFRAPQSWQEILEWGARLIAEARRNGERFSWAGRYPWCLLADSMAHRAKEERAERERMARGRWKPHGWCWSSQDGVWLICELTTVRQLQEEGREMGHCVRTYSDHCLRGGSAIFALRRNGERCLTIDVDLVNGWVRQASGRHNRPPTDDEEAVLGTWQRECLLKAENDEPQLTKEEN